MIGFKASLLSSISHSRASIPRNEVSSLSKLFTTSHPKSKSEDSDRARLHEFIHGKCKSGLCVEGRIMEATRFLKKMISFGCRPDVVTFATLIHGLCRSDNTIVALQLHEQVVNALMGIVNTVLPGRGIHADAIIYTSLIHGLCCVGDWEEAKSLFIEMFNQGVQPNTYTYSILMDGYCLVGRIHDAEKLFVSMERN
ncbi:hypothetical protein EZV62_008216 [Acer yangbiense]|uniref:Pentacotripeptide-repeat region of PRORP domain-containing protein n=1 Tax=Acer yangbiense TaxID=1000413 RepID=A0A5C7ICS0_9ROSI|nr:hypothetical protein EZV62_008216 [Acer yangbiense]